MKIIDSVSLHNNFSAKYAWNLKVASLLIWDCSGRDLMVGMSNFHRDHLQVHVSMKRGKKTSHLFKYMKLFVYLTNQLQSHHQISMIAAEFPKQNFHCPPIFPHISNVLKIFSMIFPQRFPKHFPDFQQDLAEEKTFSLLFAILQSWQRQRLRVDQWWINGGCFRWGNG